MKKIIASLSILLFSVTMAFSASPLLPDPKLTPGAVNPKATKEVICVRGYTAGKDADGEPVRDVSQALKNQVFKEYNVDPKSDQFEIDHLISLQLGGSNDITNLWPQSYTTKPLNARIKDGLENRLHALICKGQIDLATAQKEISTDWTKAYEKYVGPLPK